MKLKPFDYSAPEELDTVLSRLESHGETTALLAGGTDLIPLLKRGVSRPEYVLNLKNVKGLAGIVRRSGMDIGALTTIRALEKSEDVRGNCRILAEAASKIGHVQIRNIGTIGGNISHASPAADFAPVLMVLDAEVEVMNLEGKRILPIKDFFLGPGKTVLESNEIIWGFRIPEVDQASTYAFKKVPSRSSKGLAVANIAVLMSFKGDDSIVEDARVAVGAMGPTPIRCSRTEQLLIGEKISGQLFEAASETLLGETEPISDIRASKAYREALIKALTEEALAESYRRHLD